MIQTTLNGSNLPVLQSQFLLKETGIVHFSTMRGDVDASPFSKYNLCSYSGDNKEHVETSRRAFADCLGISLDRMWFPRQVHGTNILVVDSSMPDDQEADAVITREPYLLIGVSTADCVPVVLYDPKNRTIAAIHAGWRGTIAEITKKTVERFCEVSGGYASDILAMVGPSISPFAFEVGAEVADIFVQEEYGECVIDGYEKPHIDLWKANEMQLIASGVSSSNIDCTPMCTYGNFDRLFSARRLGIKSGRIVSAIMLVEK